ncbi:hypothetical protein SAMN02910275_01056 [Butyrivibrio sp. INlla18]|nr:hypothetical protein SAMN02910275_01056 [Butyrivibrio sp. INlla18]
MSVIVHISLPVKSKSMSKPPYFQISMPFLRFFNFLGMPFQVICIKHMPQIYKYTNIGMLFLHFSPKDMLGPAVTHPLHSTFSLITYICKTSANLLHFLLFPTHSFFSLIFNTSRPSANLLHSLLFPTHFFFSLIFNTSRPSANLLHFLLFLTHFFFSLIFNTSRPSANLLHFLLFLTHFFFSLIFNTSGSSANFLCFLRPIPRGGVDAQSSLLCLTTLYQKEKSCQLRSRIAVRICAGFTRLFD